ncbi:MAG: hypothetical protein LBJ72_06355 [Dysgonamonadaceae bacterium]|nr:hypothetical protein [Dysgonamonadaceae bacterium]
MAVLIVGIITLGIYRLFELYARRKERILMVEKFAENAKPVDLDLSLLFFKKRQPIYSTWALKISLLMIGIGLGAIIAFFIQYAMIGDLLTQAHDNWDIRRNLDGFKETIYFSCVAMFGGIGLLTAYLIELKQQNNDRK